MRHLGHLDACYFKGPDRAFAVVCDPAYFPGLWALLNSIYAYHGAQHAVFVFSRGLTREQKARLGHHPLVIRLREHDELPFRSPGTWETKQQVFASLMPEARCVYLLDADVVLTSRVDDVFALAEAGKIVASRDGTGVNFNQDYARYDPSLVGKRQAYVNSGNVCLDTRRHWTLAAMWAFAAPFGAYSPGGGAPLRLPGHGDQGALNAILGINGSMKEVHVLPEEEWCDNHCVSPLKIESAESSGRLKVRNEKTGSRQRLVHCSGPKWWTNEGRARLASFGDKLRCFEHFHALIPLEPPAGKRKPGKPPRILVGVCSCVGNEARRDACRATWMKNVPAGVKVVFFGGNGAPAEPDLWLLDSDDGASTQSAKVQAFFIKALAGEQFDYLMKCDDDTYVVLERLPGLVATNAADFIGDGTLAGDGRHAIGGAGYLISREALGFLAAAKIPKMRCEDAVFSWLARELGLRVGTDDRLRAGKNAWPNVVNDLVTAHGFSPEEMRLMHEHFAPGEGERWFKATHPQWEGLLCLRPGGDFLRHGANPEGTWRFADDGKTLRLLWHHWGEDILGQTGHGFANDALKLEAVQWPGRPSGPQVRKLILKNWLSPGDIITLTAAVRDLHQTHPEQFVTDIRTPCAALWENNPHITPLKGKDEGVETIQCEYPLINQSNSRPYHMIHGFRLFLQEKLGVPIEPHAFKGDIHLSAEEKGWMSQVEEIEGIGARFWIIVSGGKGDFTAKWWDPARAQQIVDHFQGRIRFVQCGEAGHHHPKLRNVVDFVGKTGLRQMIRLMYHADGVICPVTMFMHLAAAVETKPGRPKNRPCVVVAGGREPSHWEAYPHHQFLHTMGALSCCDHGGCWKSRVEPLGDGNEKDQSLCLMPVTLPSGRKLPRCLDMITAADVIRAVENYLRFDTFQPAPNKTSADQGRPAGQAPAIAPPVLNPIKEAITRMKEPVTRQEMEAAARALQSAKAAQALPLEQFDALHARFRAEDSNGTTWTVGVHSAKWHRLENGNWVPGDPPARFEMDASMLSSLRALAPQQSQPAPPAAPPVASGAKCAACGAALAAKDRFCPKCGSRVEEPKPPKCAACGELLRPGMAFCPNCGQRAGAPPPVAASPKPPPLIAAGPKQSNKTPPVKSAVEIALQKPPAPAPTHCAACGQPLKPGAKFCRGCGKKVA